MNPLEADDVSHASGISRSASAPSSSQPSLRQRAAGPSIPSARVARGRDDTSTTSPITNPPTFQPNPPRRSSTTTPPPPPPPLARRRSSFLSTISDFDDGNGSPMVEVQEEKPSYWHHAPLIFAVAPMVAGLLFQNGSAFATDVLLLGLAAIFLNWSVTVPWEWYHSAQEILQSEQEDTLEDTPETADPLSSSTILEEDESEDGESHGSKSADPKAKDTATKPAEENSPPSNGPQAQSPEQTAAIQELRRQETYAQILCFVGPMIGAYLLHAIRGQLTRPSEGLVSNYNLTLFVLAAELRPCLHALKLVRARTLHLQRVASRSNRTNPFEPTATASTTEMAELAQRLEMLEDRLQVGEDQENQQEKGKEKEMDTASVDEVKNTLQPQLDALNRAVRRYEKRTATQVIQTEARLQNLEGRIRDALALSAAAMRKDQMARRTKMQKPGVISQAIGFTASAVWWPIGTGIAIVQWPFETIRRVLLGKTEKRKGKKSSTSDGSRPTRVAKR